MTTLLAAVNQISLGLATVSVVMVASLPPTDLTLNADSLGLAQVSSVNQTTGELNQSLGFDLSQEEQSLPKPKNMTAKVVNKPTISPPESPYENLFAKYAAQFGLDVNVLKKIAWCESHYHPDSHNISGGYGGMFQFSTSTWASTRGAMGADPNPELRFDAEQAIMTAAFKIAAGGIRAWPVCSTR